MHKITLTNNFHGRSITILSDADTPTEAWYRVQSLVHGTMSEAQYLAGRKKYRRIVNALCGIAGCQCGVFRPYNERS